MKNKLLILFLFITLLTPPVLADDAKPVIPVDAKIEYNKGIDCYKLGQYEDAIASYRTAIRLYPDYIDAYYNLGSLLEYLKQYDEALAIFEQIISRNPKEYEAIYKAASLSLILGDNTNAVQYITMLPASNKYYAKAQVLANKYNLAKPANNLSPLNNQNQTAGCYPNITSPTGVTTDKNGNLFVSSFTDNVLYKITPNGKKMLFYKGTYLKGPISIASDYHGNIYIANYNANNVLKITASGACSIIASNVSKPYGIHCSGNILYVACQGSNSILRVKIH